MRGRNDFVMDTKGYCLLCLKSSSIRRDELRDPRGEMLEDLEDEGSPKVISLQRVCHYLRLNMRNVFKDLIAAAPTMASSSSASVLEKSELKGVLCAECSEMTETVSDITLELEVLQMTLDELVKKMRDKVEEGGRNRELLEGFKREMLSSPQTLIHFGIVEQLRKETLKKCHLMMGRTQPRVIVEKLGFGIIDLQNIDGGSSSSPPPPQGLDVDAPELREATPVISSVRGSYHVDDSYPGSTPKSSASMMSCEPDIGMEPSVGVIDFDADEPISIKVEQEMTVDEEVDDDYNPIFPHVVMVEPTTPDSPQVPSPPPGSRKGRTDCKYCHQSFMYVSQRKDHERTIHEGILFECGICPSTFQSRNTRNRHRRLVHEVSFRRGKHSINVQKSGASKVGRPNDQIQANKFKRLGAISRKLPTGPKRGNRKHRWHPSYKPEMGSARKREPGFQCEYCPMKFWHLSNKFRHMKTFHNYLSIRERRQLGDPAPDVQSEPPSSNDGNHNIQIEDNASGEIPIHEDDQNQGSSLDKKDDRKDCKYCGKSFMFACYRVDHERTIHEGILFECGMCPFTSKHRSMRNKHRQTVHNMNMKKSRKQSIHPVRQGLQFQCPFCPLSYRSQPALNMHRYRKHRDQYKPVKRGPGKAKFRCEYCPMKFTDRSNKRRHMKTAHNHLTQRQISELVNGGVASESSSPKDNQNLQIRDIERVEVTDKIPEDDFLPEYDTEQGSSSGKKGNRKVCKYCHKSFMHACLRVDHERTIHEGILFECGMCPFNSKFRSMRNRHRQTVHNVSVRKDKATLDSPNRSVRTLVKREMKNAVVAAASGLNNTVKGPDSPEASTSPNQDSSVGQGLKFPCQLCTSSFRSQPSLNMHRNRKHKKRGRPGKLNFRCEYCHMKFSQSSNRLRHMRTVHNHPSQPRRRRRKDATPDDQSQSSSYDKLHLQILDSERVEVEVEINEGAEQEPDFLSEDEPGPSSQDHLDSDPARKYKCQQCPKRFKFSTGLRNHQIKAHFHRPATAHATERKFKCATCGKKFVTATHLRIHRNSVHAGIKYLCQYCSSEFTLLGSMRTHMRKCCLERFQHMEGGAASNEGGEKYETEQVPVVHPGNATDTDELDKHQEQQPKTQHNTVEVVPGLDGRYKCPHCRKKFNSVRSMRQHSTMAHLRHKVIRKYKCELCPKTFILKTHLGRHRRLSHF